MPPVVTVDPDLEVLLSHLPNLTPNDAALIERAYRKAELAHAGQRRKSGEPFFTHCVAVANILAEMRLDAEAIAAALMHDTIEDTSVTYEDLQAEFSKKIADLVNGVTKLRKLPLNVEKDQAGRRPRDTNRELESMRKMLLTISDDIRIVLIKLADRLHNMRTLGYMPPEKQVRIAQETMDIFTPLANRLGIWQIKWELEDLSLRYLNPEQYRIIAHQIDERRSDREAYMRMIGQHLIAELKKNGIENAAISARPKHIYSIYRKMERKQLPFEEIFDVRAVRIIVDTVPQCYLCLGIVHNLWRPIKEEFDDYIAAPKDNFYQSLHTAVHDHNGKIVEVQIRTREMHEHAEYGVAAHWRYKEGNNGVRDERFEQRISYLRRLMEFGPDINDDPEAFIESMKTDVFQDRVYVYTPKGDIIDLPANSTPIDFAYHIHTEIGHRCRGAKVNGRIVSLNYQLRSGERVEIMTASRGGPSLDWLNTNQGYVTTHRAASKIRHYFRKLNHDKHIDLGRDVVERELKRLGMMESMSFEYLATLFNYDKTDDFMAAVGSGDVNAAQIANKALEEEERQRKRKEDISALVRKPTAPLNGGSVINVNGGSGMLTNLAACCHPMPGDPIVGFITRGRGVTVHRSECVNIAKLPDHEKERLVSVSWGNVVEGNRFRVPVEIVAYDREGLIRDISTIIADEHVNLADVRVSTRQDIATLNLVMELRSNQQLTRILSRLGQIRNVTDVYRCNPT